jgi:SAM-dependent methyltransferase
MAEHFQLDNEQFVRLVLDAVHDKQFLLLVLSDPVGRKTASVSKVSLRTVQLRDGESLQFASQQGNQESHENLAKAAAEKRLGELFGVRFRRAHLFTSDFDLEAKSKSGIAKCVKTPPSKTGVERVSTHNRSKDYLIPEGQPCAFLHEVGIMTKSGQVRAKKQDKFRQINRFLEFVNDIIGSLPKEGPLRVIDFGCGKSYLTFALHHLLTQIHGREVEIVGLDLKADVIEHCNAIARQLSCQGLTFQQGDIRNHDHDRAIDLCVCLHACDTATDAALEKALSWNVSAVLAVPCCQHEIAAKMIKSFATLIQRHGIHRERLATMATDSLRALALESRGYRTQVLEFIDTEHTPKNVLIRAVKRDSFDKESAQKKAEEYQQLKRDLGLNDIAIDAILSDERQVT